MKKKTMTGKRPPENSKMDRAMDRNLRGGDRDSDDRGKKGKMPMRGGKGRGC